ncbi:hypothetical protein TWF694_007924 [Orbilia ellipsospora]|uniref:DUF7905 domain-containing protein n=1 Tax=Orbilia ellipsospora TaxID=2528407 RepID=A0AAV9XLR6_9PEZI
MSRRYPIPPIPPSDTGTSISDGSSLPIDPEFANAAIWNTPARARVPDEATQRKQEDNKIENVDKWVRDLYLEDEAVRDAVQQGLRTTDLTRRYFDEKSLAPSTPPLSSIAPSVVSTSDEPEPARQPQRAAAAFPTFGDLSRIQRDRPSRAPQGAAQFLGQRTVNTRGPDRRRLEGPAQDMRKLNPGDRLARDHPTEPTDAYLFPARAKEKAYGKNERNLDMESRVKGFDRLHIQAIADLTGTHMKFPEDYPDDWTNSGQTTRLNRIRIWGDREAVAKAKVYLVYLNKHADKDVQVNAKKALGWAKVKALPDKRHREAITKKEKEKEEKGRFRSSHDANENFPYIGVFDWPNSEIDPAHTLGLNYEALDPIRMDHGVYIIYSAKRKCFRVLGYTSESIEQALDRIYTVFCEITARNRSPVHYNLVNPPDKYHPQIRFNRDHEMHTILEPYKLHEGAVGADIYLADDGKQPQHSNWPERVASLRRANERFIKAALDSCLKDIFYTRMYAKLRIYFGTMIIFSFSKAKDNIHGLEEYMEMVRTKMTKGDVIRHFGSNKVGEKLLEYCERHTRPNFEVEFNHGNPHNEDDYGNTTMEPNYSSSMWVLVTRKPNPTSEMKLEVEFERTTSGKYRVTAHRWLKILRTEAQGDSQIVRKKMPLDIKMIDLERGIDYQYDLTLGQPIQEVEKMPILTEFVLHLDLVDSLDGKSKRVSYIALPGIRVTSITTKKKWPYYFAGTPYVFEITRYEYIRSKDAVTLRLQNFNEGGFPKDFSQYSTNDVMWGADLYSSDWDATFGEQVNLPIGYTGEWAPSLEEFLKATSKKIHVHGRRNTLGRDAKAPGGWEELQQKIGECIKIIKGVKLAVLGDNSLKFIDAKGETKPSLQGAQDAQGAQRKIPPAPTTLARQAARFMDSSVESDGDDCTVDSTSVGDYGDEIEIEEEEEDNFARLPVSGRGGSTGKMLNGRQDKGQGRSVTESEYSVYGNTEFSFKQKKKAGSR